jgi:hypothetical protein
MWRHCDRRQQRQDCPLAGRALNLPFILRYHDMVSDSYQLRNRVPPFYSYFFERGVIASMSVNDTLMVKGLIYPPVYIQFFDLSYFSRL